MNVNELNEILNKHKKWLLEGNGRDRANLQGSNLQNADLPGVVLVGANLQEANLQDANLRGADLRSADLQDADLQGADLQDTDLRSANLQGANLDYSCLPLWCSSKGMIVDRKIAAQIAAHFCALTCDDPDYQLARSAILEFAQSSHRAEDLGILEEK